jgi:hypothetical protein
LNVIVSITSKGAGRARSFHPWWDYEWHPLAKLFQTPKVAEEWMAKLEPKEFTSLLEQLAMPSG